MGRKKQFIDKKNSATFQLLARDSSSVPQGAQPLSDRVFVRVDNNPYNAHGLLQEQEEEERGDDSIFADAPEDTDDVEGPWIGGAGPSGPLPEHVRREILELGLPDDGYNYLFHLREISGAGAGSTYYHNPKARLDRLPFDVKAYDASRLRISSEAGGESNEGNGDFMHMVASATVGVKVQKVIDPDVLRLLDDDDISRFELDVEDLEEDFVVKANQPDEGQEDDQKKIPMFGGKEKKLDTIDKAGLGKDTKEEDDDVVEEKEKEEEEKEDGIVEEVVEKELGRGQKPRVRRPLDEQFDLLTLQEYDNDSDSDDAFYVDDEGESLAAKLKDALKEYAVDDLQLEDKYRVPGDFVHGIQGSNSVTQVDACADVIRRSAQYVEMCYDEDEDDEEVVLPEESSSESERDDCETIISTYSNRDNHPGKIEAPRNSKKRVQTSLIGNSATKDNVIELRGKHMLPIDGLPKKSTVDELKKAVSSRGEKQKRRPHGQESKEERKERKATVKEERRAARRAKKELKGVYMCETQRAQKVAAASGPSSIHIM